MVSSAVETMVARRAIAIVSTLYSGDEYLQGINEFNRCVGHAHHDGDGRDLDAWSS